MKQLRSVDPIFVYQVWEQIKHFFKSDNNPRITDTTIDGFKMNVLNKHYSLFVVTENEKIIGSFIFNFTNSLEHKTLFIVAFGGKGVANKEVAVQVEDWAKSQGATRIQAFAQDAQARLFRIVMGLEKYTNVIEKSI